MAERLRRIAEDARGYATEQRDTERACRELESAGAAISRTSRPLESVIYHEQQIRDEQERQAQELARRWHEEQEPEARIWRGPSMGM